MGLFSTLKCIFNNQLAFRVLATVIILIQLSVAKNGLTRMNQFEALLKLKVLDLKDNHIEAIEGKLCISEHMASSVIPLDSLPTDFIPYLTYCFSSKMGQPKK